MALIAWPRSGAVAWGSRLGVLVWSLVGAPSLLSCSGRATHNEAAPSSDSPPTLDAASEADANGAACTPGDNLRCLANKDCCSRLCWYRSPGDSFGVCFTCAGFAEPCHQQVNLDNDCCSASCGYDGTCVRGALDQPCHSDTDCGSGFCYAEAGACRSDSCDPRLHPEITDPMTCQ